MSLSHLLVLGWEDADLLGVSLLLLGGLLGLVGEGRKNTLWLDELTRIIGMIILRKRVFTKMSVSGQCYGGIIDAVIFCSSAELVWVSVSQHTFSLTLENWKKKKQNAKILGQQILWTVEVSSSTLSHALFFSLALSSNLLQLGGEGLNLLFVGLLALVGLANAEQQTLSQLCLQKSRRHLRKHESMSLFPTWENR